MQLRLARVGCGRWGYRGMVTAQVSCGFLGRCDLQSFPIYSQHLHSGPVNNNASLVMNNPFTYHLSMDATCAVHSR